MAKESPRHTCIIILMPLVDVGFGEIGGMEEYRRILRIVIVPSSNLMIRYQIRKLKRKRIEMG